MKTAISWASALACAFSLNAQITAVLTRFPARSPEIEIRNNSTVSLTAFAITMAPVAKGSPNSSPLLVYVDTAVDTDRLVSHGLNTAMPLLPNQVYSVPVPTRFRGSAREEDLYEPPIVTAGVFADGTTTGDPALLARLIVRRSNMVQAVELARDMLSDAGSHNVPRGQLIGEFQRMADSVNHWYLPPEQKVGRTLYQSIVEKLMNLPELQPGSPFPPTDFVERETALLNRQRTTLLNSQPGLADRGRIRR
ncbi:exported hypothetical protein [Candidatus Sulfopaludibacter sp. SbA4]|nr:exported hypothetical protein [Candidatus Sulfopaludibacter sp. SbA4]